MFSTYTKRMSLAVLLSALFHAALFGVLQYTYEGATPAPLPEPEPIVLNLQPPPPLTPPAPRQLVDVQQPAETPPAPSDRIAETHSEAMDLARNTGGERGPQLKLDEFDALPKPASPDKPSEPESAPPPPKQQEEKRVEKAPDAAEDIIPMEEIEASLESVGDPDTVTERTEPVPEAPIKIAKASPAIAPPQRPSPGTSRQRSGLSKQGATNFDAIQDEIAPYLKHIRERVERSWNEMLYTRYSGTSPAKAVIDCSINPQGELVSVTVVGPNGDRLYGALCKESVLKAGPFGKFPFEVPDIYRDKNLEIRWTFNFL